MKTLCKVAFNKIFLIAEGLLCLLLILLRLIFPLLGIERAELDPVDFSVDTAGTCYLGREDNVYVFEDDVHTDTLTLPKTLAGYDSFAVLPEQILFRKDSVLWQSSLDLSDVQVCADQTGATVQLRKENEKDSTAYKMRSDGVLKIIPHKMAARVPFCDLLFRWSLGIFLLVILIHGCRVSILVYKLNRNSKFWLHPNWDD